MLSRAHVLSFSFAAFLLNASVCVAQSKSISHAPFDTKAYLEQFHSNPRALMNSPLPKTTEDGRIIRVPALDESGTKKLVKAKNEMRSRICAAAGNSCEKRPAFFAAPNESNLIQQFLEGPFINNIAEIDRLNLRESVLTSPPWSDSYWPTKKGLIARRWSDDTYPDSDDWALNHGHFLSFPPGYRGINEMAPSEKYDLLVGDSEFTLTKSQWARGQRHIEENGRVLSWAGLCHGWAPASLKVQDPKGSVTVKAANGQDITFYPSDIKALASLLWGEGKFKLRQVGRRCRVTDPTDSDFGRTRDDDCFDVNPATWHLAVVNQIGVEKRGFVFDSVYDTQVWNYPVSKYSFEYFNPQTMTPTSNLGSAMVSASDYSRDKFREFRSPGAVWFVGVAMNLTYTEPTRASRNPNTKIRSLTVKYLYDLELDAEARILGGEWYSNWHPDFIWSPVKDGPVTSIGEERIDLSGWDGSFPIPPNVADAAKISSSKEQPLSRIVQQLVNLGQQ